LILQKNIAFTLFPNENITLHRYATNDIEFEDIFMFWKGREEFERLLKLTKAVIENAKFDIRAEHHGQHEIVIEWTVRRTSKHLT